MVETAFELMEYLAQRGAPYDISAEELLQQIPENVRAPKLAYEYMQLKDISHIEPLSLGGESAGDNWLLEDSSPNRARGAQVMTEAEQQAAALDAQSDADRLIKGTAGALGKGSTLVAATEVIGVATGVAEGASAVSALVAAAPVLLTCGAIAGLCWLFTRD